MSDEDDRDLVRILRVLDEDAELPTGTQERIWRRIERHRARRRNAAVAVAAAAVLLLVGAMAVVSLGDGSPVEVATAPGIEPTGPCATFRASERSPQDLRTEMLSGTLKPAELDAASAAVAVLRSDLVAAGQIAVGDRIHGELNQIAGALRQAYTSLSADDRAGALRALDFAVTAYEEGDIGASSCLG
jgi:hypothetical protein